MKIVYNIYVAVRKLWTAVFGKDGDGKKIVIPGRIKNASGDVTVGSGLELASGDTLNCTVPTPTTVVANPTMAGTEGDLTGLQVGDTKYAVLTGTTVVANPTMAGTEGDLTGLQVGDTKYKVGGGKKYYRHNVKIAFVGKSYMFITSSGTQFTTTTFAEFLYANGYTGNTKYLGIAYEPGTGGMLNNDQTRSIYGLYSSNGTTLSVVGVILTYAQGESSLTISKTAYSNNTNVEEDVVFEV